MAQTKRKRRSKHRGNAAGSIETRGRTGRKLTPAEQKKAAARGPRTLKPPTWQSALVKAAMMSVLLFVLTRIGLFGKDVPIAQSAVLALFALVMYTPLAFLTDRWAYGRQQRRLASGR
jgi:type VI protein secretion system component VasF